MRLSTRRARRVLALLLAFTLVSSVAGTSVAGAKAKKKTTKKKTTAKKTTKKASPSVTAPGQVKKGTLLFGGIYFSVDRVGVPTQKEVQAIGDAWATLQNARGGINGYKIKIEWRDSKYDTARWVQQVKELDKLGVLAIAGTDGYNQEPATDAYTQKAQLPIVGGQPYAQGMDDHLYYFPVSGSYYAGFWGSIATPANMGFKKIADFHCTGIAACDAGIPIRQHAADHFNVSYDPYIGSSASTDATALCLAAKAKGDDYLMTNGGGLLSVIVPSCSRQNFHPTYGQGGGANQATIDALNGESFASILFDNGVFYDGPEMKDFRDAVQLTKVKLGSLTGNAINDAWLGWEMAGAAIRKLTQANPTRADFVNALRQIKGETLGGQIPPMDYTMQVPGGKHSQQECWSSVIVKDGQLYMATGKGQIAKKLLDAWTCGTDRTLPLPLHDYS